MVEIVTEMLSGTSTLIFGMAIVMVVVFLAMCVDLVAGLYKASLRGEVRRSEALKRTGYKVAIYEGTIFIASSVDLMIHIAKLPLWFGWNIVYGIPLVTIALGIFWCAVEFLSVREKADAKTHSNMSKIEKIASQVLTREEWISILAEAMKKGLQAGQIPNPGPKDLDPIDGNDL